MSINRVIIIGNLGNDPEIKSFQDGSKVANFSVGISEGWKDKQTGEKKSKTEWVNVAAFGNVVKFISEYAKKGDKVYVEGSLKTDKYQKDGKDCYATKVVIQGYSGTFQIVSAKNKEVDAHNSAKANAYQPYEEYSDDSIIPF